MAWENNLTAIIETMVGAPKNDLEHFVILLAASCISVLGIYFVFYLFKSISEWFK